jgi:N-acyl-D-aspartate/D-glutamate deacylase
MFDVVIKNDIYFDGKGDLGMGDGRISAISERPLEESGCANVIDARGK